MSIISTGPGKTPRIIRLAEVKRRTGLSTSTIYAMMARGEFPRQVYLSKGAVGWVDQQIDAHNEARIGARDANWQTLGDAAARVVGKLGKSRR